MNLKTLQQQVTQFPKGPGVYLMKNAKGEVLYVGKASNLRSRVGSYFSKEANSRYQVQFLMSKVAGIEPILTDNPKEALLLENILIKKHRPRYNIQLRDDKSYVSLKLSIRDPFPRLYVTRRIKKDGSLYFGPYTAAGSVREVVDFIENHFRLRTCSDHDFRNRVRPCLQYQIHRCDAPCVGFINSTEYAKIAQQVRYFLEGKTEDLKKTVRHLMAQASEKEEYEEAARYRDLLQDIDRTTERQKVVSHEHLSRDVLGMYREGEAALIYTMMVREGSLQESRPFSFKTYEENDELLTSFLSQYYEEGKFIPSEILVPFDLGIESPLSEILSERAGRKVEVLWPQRGEKVSLLNLAKQNAKEAFQRRQQKEKNEIEILREMQGKLELKNFPHRIEGYDISNFQGQESVGSMVVFQGGKPHRQDYRHFKIKTVEGANDFASIYEVIYRRMKKGFESQEKGSEDAWIFPDLMMIDGGKGQLNAAAQALKDLKISKVDLISLAKSRLEGEERHRSDERVFLLNRKDPLILPQNSSVLFLLVQLRDEAHRFGIEFHRKLSKKRSLYSALDQILGVGKIRRQKLLKHFGSLKRIKEAEASEISRVLGVPLALGKKIRESL